MNWTGKRIFTLAGAVLGLFFFSYSSLMAAQWTNLGPGSINSLDPTPIADIGRVLFFTADPSNANNHWLISGLGTGIWETKDAGNTWLPRTDNMSSMYQGPIEFAPGNPSIVYTVYDLDAMGGVFKSTDGGTTWAKVSSPDSTLFRANVAPFVFNNFTHIQVDTNNPPVTIEVAADRYDQAADLGVFRSVDGGRTFTRSLTAGSCTALEVQPGAGNFKNQYAGANQILPGNANPSRGLYRTTDGGNTWTKMMGTWENNPNNVGRFEITISKSNSNILYVAVSDGPFNVTSTVWMTSNAWDPTPANVAWTKLPNPAGFPEAMVVDPNNSSVLYLSHGEVAEPGTGTTDSIERIDLSQSNPQWVNISHTPNGFIHVDVRGMGFAGNQLMGCSDGGLYGTTTPGQSWTSYNNKGLRITQFYQGAVRSGNPAIVMGGTQDNGTPLRQSDPNAPWMELNTGDGFSAFFSKSNPQNMAAGGFSASLLRSFDGGANLIDAIGNTPNGTGIDQANSDAFEKFEMSPFDDNTMVVGGNGFVQKTINLFQGAGVSVVWSKVSPQVLFGGNIDNPIVFAFAPSDSTGKTLAFGTLNGQVWLTTAGGGTWSQGINNGKLPTRKINGIAFDPGNANTLYVCNSAYDGTTGTGRVFVTHNALAASPASVTWSPIHFPIDITTGQELDVPCNTLAVDPNAPSNLYVGTDIGVFLSVNGGTFTQQGASAGMPNVIVNDLRSDKSSGTLTAFTYGRGAFQLQTAASNGSPTATPTRTATFTATATPTQTVCSSLAKLFLGTGATNPQHASTDYLDLSSSTGAVNNTTVWTFTANKPVADYLVKPAMVNAATGIFPPTASTGFGWESPAPLSGNIAAGTWTFANLYNTSTGGGLVIFNQLKQEVAVYAFNPTSGTTTLLFTYTNPTDVAAALFPGNFTGSNVTTTFSTNQPAFTGLSGAVIKVEYYFRADVGNGFNGAVSMEDNTANDFVSFPSAPCGTTVPTNTPTITVTATFTATSSPTADFTPTPRNTSTFTVTPTATFTTGLPTSTFTPTKTPTATFTAGLPTATSTPTRTPTATFTPAVPTATFTFTRTFTSTPTPTHGTGTINCSGLPVWTTVGMPVYNAGTTVKYAPNNSAYKALVTVFGQDAYSPPTSPSVWQLLGGCQ